MISAEQVMSHIHHLMSMPVDMNEVSEFHYHQKRGLLTLSEERNVSISCFMLLFSQQYSMYYCCYLLLNFCKS
jgi:hypothetical protein